MNLSDSQRHYPGATEIVLLLEKGSVRGRFSTLLKKIGFAVFVFVLIVSCNGSIENLPINDGVSEIPCCGKEFGEYLQVKYLGAEGFLIKRGKDIILTAPLFSNPSLLRVGLWKIKPDSEKIDRFLPPVETVEAILVGHAHYDHLMDVPYIAQKYALNARIYGSQTMKNILCAVLPEDRLVALDEEAATSTKVGKWQYIDSNRIRFMAIKSEHAPHVDGIKFYSGEVSGKLDALPERASGWKEGQTFAYLIDFLNEDGTIYFRIHFQDAASNPPWGFPPVLEDRDKKVVDVAIVCVPGFNNVKDYPEGVIQYINPHFVILGHWEDLFSPYTENPTELKVVPFTDPNEFISRMKNVLPPDSGWIMPKPGAWLRFKPT